MVRDGLPGGGFDFSDGFADFKNYHDTRPRVWIVDDGRAEAHAGL